MPDYLQQITETTGFLKDKTGIRPEIGIILGTGLGGLVKEIDVKSILSYQEIPNFPVSTVETHAGKLISGFLGRRPVIAMQGRFHYYEGYSMQQITFPVRVMKKLGINTLLISNASGGMNPKFRRGDLMVIDDHINLLGGNPLIGANLDEFGPRFPDMSEPYSRKLIGLVEKIARQNKIKIHRGVFVAVSGPNLETRAEYRYLRVIGADAVGMSTVPETIAAVHSGLQVLGISVITDECFPETLKPVKLADIVEAANQAEPKLTLLMRQFVESL
jgi:purine-nucleoside phosphorylase